MYDAHKAEK
jgi:hypothetical protein